MIHSHRWFLVLALIVLLSPGFARAQQIAPTLDQAEIKAVRDKAFKLLESVADQLNSLQSRENRARMGSNLVESLWKHDEERARNLLRMVQEDIRAELQKTEKSSHEDQKRYGVFVRLRHDTVERVAKHDPEAALEFLKATGPVDPQQVPYELSGNEAVLELRLAKQVAANNPEVALKLARESLERGFSQDLLMLVWRLNRKHKPQARTLYKEIVEKLRNADLVNDWSTRYFAQGLARAFPPQEIDEPTFRELVGVFVTTALNNGCANKLSQEDTRVVLCSWAMSSVSNMEAFDSRAARLRHWTSGSDEDSFGLRLAYESVEELVNEDAVAELEALASKHPEVQEHVYNRLIQKARNDGDFEKARKYVNRYVPDAERQQQIMREIDSEKKEFAISKDRMAQIQTRLAEIPEPRQRAWVLYMNAHEFGATDRNTALKLLNQAKDIVDAMNPGEEQTETRLILAMLFCFEKSDHGFSMMESLVPKLNELVEIAAKLDGYDTSYLRDGEWNMSSNGSVGRILVHLSRGAAYFAWADFDRAVSLTSQFERPEIRMMGHLKLAQGILEGPPKRMVQR